MAIAVVIPGQFGESRSAPQVYAPSVDGPAHPLAAIVLVLFVGAGHVVANRGALLPPPP